MTHALFLIRLFIFNCCSLSLLRPRKPDFLDAPFTDDEGADSDEADADVIDDELDGGKAPPLTSDYWQRLLKENWLRLQKVRSSTEAGTTFLGMDVRVKPHFTRAAMHLTPFAWRDHSSVTPHVPQQLASSRRRSARAVLLDTSTMFAGLSVMFARWCDIMSPGIAWQRLLNHLRCVRPCRLSPRLLGIDCGHSMISGPDECALPCPRCYLMMRIPS